ALLGHEAKAELLQRRQRADEERHHHAAQDDQHADRSGTGKEPVNVVPEAQTFERPGPRRLRVDRIGIGLQRNVDHRLPPGRFHKAALLAVFGRANQAILRAWHKRHVTPPPNLWGEGSDAYVTWTQ